MKNHVCLALPLIFFYVIMMNTTAWADTIRLTEGSVITGKIVKEDKKEIIFTNSYGTFKIKRAYIRNIYKTKSYTEDIKIQRRLKIQVNEGTVRKNYYAGLDKQQRVAKGEKAIDKDVITIDKTKKGYKVPVDAVPADEMWTGGRLSFSASYLYNLRFPSYQYAGHFSIDQGLDRLVGKRHPMMFGLRVESGYVYFNRPTKKIKGFVCGVGPMWAFPSLKSRWGCIVFALLPGVSFLQVKINRFSDTVQGYAFSGQSILGYQKSFGVFSMFIHARYMYTYRLSIFTHSIGGEIGFGFNAW